MKKKFLTLLPALLLLVSLAACGGSSGGDSGSASIAGNNGGWSGYQTNSYETEESKPDETDVPETPPAAGALPASTKMIYSADISLETTEFESAEQAIGQIVEELGGWFESRSTYLGGGYRNLRCTVRVPAEQFGAFLDRAGQAAHVTSRDEYAEDVSEEYYDSESRLATQRTKLERLQLLLSQAEGMEDIISLETAISETELEIEHLTGSLRKYDSLVGYSTITLRLQEVYRLSSDEEAAVTFGQRMGGAFTAGLSRGIRNLEEFCIAMARNWLNLLVLAAVIAVIVLLFRTRKQKKNIKPPQPPAPPESKK